MIERDEVLLKCIKEIKSNHPFWGYRRVWAYLKYREGVHVNKKAVYRLLKENDLLVKRNMRLKAKRSHKSKPKPTQVNEWWGIDMTKVMIDGFGWVYVVMVLDWHTKKIVGHHADLQSKTSDWLVALGKGVNQQFPDGVRGKGLKLMSDNGCQPTSIKFMEACSILGIKQAFTSYNNPKGNADTERLMRTMKEELVWLNDWKSPTQFIQALDCWVEEYNHEYLHSALGYKSPVEFENQCGDTPLIAA